MNCQAPFPDDDPLFPSQDPRFGECPHCGYEHRLDLGCYLEVRKSQDDSETVVALCVLLGIGCLLGAMIAQAVWG